MIQHQLQRYGMCIYLYNKRSMVEGLEDSDANVKKAAAMNAKMQQNMQEEK